MILQPRAVVLSMLENHGYSQVQSLPSHQRLAAKGAVFTNYFDAGHPSGPNYRAVTAGSRVVDSEELNAPYPCLASRLSAIGINTHVIHAVGQIAARHNPYADMQAPHTEVSLTGTATLLGALDSPVVGPKDHFFISWDDQNNAHSGPLEVADKNLNDVLDALDESAWFNKPDIAGRFPIFVTVWDESFQGDDKVWCSFYGHSIAPGTCNTRYDHYDLNKFLYSCYGLAPMAETLSFGV